MSRFKQPHAHTHTHLSKTQVKNTQTTDTLADLPEAPITHTAIELIVCWEQPKKIENTQRKIKRHKKTQSNQQTDNTQTQQQQISGICVFNQGFWDLCPR